LTFIASIVEGHGEIAALPALLHRLATEAASGTMTRLRVNPPIRVKSGSFFNDNAYFSRYVALAVAKARQEQGAVLILLDCEDACPAVLGPRMLAQARVIAREVEVIVVLAFREFETWFVASAVSLRGCRGLAMDLDAPDRPEAIRDAKGWLDERMNVAYDPITHQLEFVRIFALDSARTNASFDRFYNKFVALTQAADNGS
jgi:hypothetical protein